MYKFTQHLLRVDKLIIKNYQDNSLGDMETTKRVI